MVAGGTGFHRASPARRKPDSRASERSGHSDIDVHGGAHLIELDPFVLGMGLGDIAWSIDQTGDSGFADRAGVRPERHAANRGLATRDRADDLANAAEVGFRDANLGANVPAAAFLRAVDDYRPALVWVSSTAAAAAETRQLLRGLGDRQAQRALTVVVGGRGLAAHLGAGAAVVHHLGSMAELAGFARALLAQPPRGADADGPRAG